MEIDTTTFKPWVRVHVNSQHEVAGRTAKGTGCTLSGHAQAVTIVGAGRDPDCNWLTAVLQGQVEFGYSQSIEESDRNFAGNVRPFRTSAALRSANVLEEITEDVSETGSSAPPAEDVLDPK